jgi:SAM-dependent methyltransferase
LSVELGPVEVVCPRDQSQLSLDGDVARCAEGHEYRVIGGIPVLLLDDTDATHPVIDWSLKQEDVAPYDGPGLDPFVQEAIKATCGNLYQPMFKHGLTDYPIPTLRLPPGDGKTLLDVGCHWGRWSIGAARQGYRAVGIDPSLRGIASARGVAKKLGADASFVVSDGRHLPFADGTFDVVFSYGVFQHFAKPDVLESFDEIARVLKPGGSCLVQLANVWGARSLMNQARERRFREQKHVFDIRYWTPKELRTELERRIGPTELSVDGFITLNPQPADLPLLPVQYRAIVHLSEGLRRVAERVPPLIGVADSLYALSRRPISA